MAPKRVRLLAWGSFAISMALSAAALVFLVLSWGVPPLPTEFGPKGFSIAFAVVGGGVGAVLAARRPGNPIGWIFCGVGVVSALQALGADYARWALTVESGRPPAGAWGAWLQEWVWIPLVGSLGVVAAIFPDGRFLSPRWRVAAWVAIGLAVIPMVLTALVSPLTIYVGTPNPIGDVGVRENLALGSLGLMFPVIVVGTASLIVRFRRSRGDERQQLKWLVLSMSIVLALVALYAAVAAPTGGAPGDRLEWAEYLMTLAFLGVPISIAFGVLKYRLYDIDVVISKAVVYGGLALFITLVYVGIVVGVGAAIGAVGSPALSAVAAAVVALAFQPARMWAQRVANRIVYGDRATPYEVLADLGERLAGEYAVDDVVVRVAETLGRGLGAERVVVWLDIGTEHRPIATWPAQAGDDDDMRTYPILHQGETLGAIGVRKPASDPLTDADEKLVTDLAGQAGLVLRNVRLIEDLRASRQRLVAAQDEERRRIERNIHDGAQQQLVALAVKLRLADAAVDPDPATARAMLAEIQADAGAALDDLRDLARGIYPPLLADRGLVAALEAQARKSPVPVHVTPDGVGRYRADVEAAVYFCTLEALQNVAKYARATRVDIGLETGDGVLRFTVADDGVGFDPAAAASGSGLTNMRDRLDALGGSLVIRSRAGRGTTIAGSLPAT
ncbi:MAG TPA: histidine kinase [Actinomycetota bacterium]|nr:histidine kinase [Actinomycetota bacterium]